MNDPAAQCRHRIPGRVSTVAEAGCSADHRSVLEIARLFFRSFAAPQSQSWVAAFPRAQQDFAGRAPERIAVCVLTAVQAMARARRSRFNFASPDCACCAQKLTEHERQFISVLMDLGAGRKSSARVNAMLLCEGAESGRFLSAMEDLGTVLGETGT